MADCISILSIRRSSPSGASDRKPIGLSRRASTWSTTRHTRSGRAVRPFQFSTIGQLAAIGRRTGVARILGVNFSGFAAWWLWRTVYLMRLPRFERKVRVALDWTLDLFFRKDIVQFATNPAPRLGQE